MGSCKHGDELGQINGERFLDLESDCRFFKKDSVLQKFDMIQILVTIAMLAISSSEEPFYARLEDSTTSRLHHLRCDAVQIRKQGPTFQRKLLPPSITRHMEAIGSSELHALTPQQIIIRVFTSHSISKFVI